jgi:transcription factor SPN1
LFSDGWSRPIFNLDNNFKQLSKDERQQRDEEHLRSIHRRSSNEFNKNHKVDDLLNRTGLKRTKSDVNDKTNEEGAPKLLRPGDKGFCPRARVPLPSSKDFIIRPKSNIDNTENTDKKVIELIVVEKFFPFSNLFYNFNRLELKQKARESCR